MKFYLQDVTVSRFIRLKVNYSYNENSYIYIFNHLNY